MADSPTQAETVDQPEPEIDSADAEAVSVEEILVEEVSIDGMCGVY
jgi:mycofactocin precursor